MQTVGATQKLHKHTIGLIDELRVFCCVHRSSATTLALPLLALKRNWAHGARDLAALSKSKLNWQTRAGSRAPATASHVHSAVCRCRKSEQQALGNRYIPAVS